MRLNLAILSVIPLLSIAVPAHSKSVLCEKYGYGGEQIIAENYCPPGYNLKGEVAVTQGAGNGAAAIDAYNAVQQAGLQRRQELKLERERIEAQNAAQAGAQRQQSIQNSRLEVNSKCLEGSWRFPNQGVLDISTTGLVYLSGELVSYAGGATVTIVNNSVSISFSETIGSYRLFYRLQDGDLVGTTTFVEVKKGFFIDKELPPVTREARLVRTTDAPAGCETTPPAAEATSTVNSDAREVGKLIAEGLTELSELYSSGLLTEEEFNAAKRRLLGL
jgi:hypothetical protein